MTNLLNTLRSLPEDGGFTLHEYNLVNYTNGYQVATHGVECTTPEEAEKAIHEFKGNAGVWLSTGIYFVDKSYKVDDRNTAVRMAMYFNQLSIYDWATDSLIWKEDYQAILEKN